MKAVCLNLAGNSIYLPYLALFVVGMLAFKELASIFTSKFIFVYAIVIVFSLIYFAMTGYNLSVFVFSAKILTTLLVSTMYIYLLRSHEDEMMNYLYYGSVVSIVYMGYQAISIAFFGTGLPFTTISALDIGRGISSRFGLLRVTGFTEEPSYMAVMLLGVMLLLYSYGLRIEKSQRKRMWVIGVGLLLCTSNNLFATIPLVFLFWIFSLFNVSLLFFVCFYFANFLVTPFLLNVDESFFARFSSYHQFLDLKPMQQILGIGFNQYRSLPIPQFVTPEGSATLVVESLGSLWGGILLEGGVVFSSLFCIYVARVSRESRHGFGFAFVAILIMLANYYSPWWPIVSLALAYSIHSQEPYIAVEAGA